MPDKLLTNLGMGFIELPCGFEPCQHSFRVPIQMVNPTDGRVYPNFRNRRFPEFGFEVSGSGYCYDLNERGDPLCFPKQCED